MKAQHTPGPWKVLQRRGPDCPGCNAEDSLYRIVLENSGGATVGFAMGECAWNNGEAKANLIAASPDLLEAAEKALKCMRITAELEGVDLDEEFYILEKAIAKARST